MSEELFLIDAVDVDGWFYIVSKSSILVTDHSELLISAEVQFIYPERAEKPKVRKGKIVMESKREPFLKKEMDIRCAELKKQQKNSGSEIKEKEKKNEEAEQKKLEMREQKRQANVDMAKELEKDLAAKKQRMGSTLEEQVNNILEIAYQLWKAVYDMKKDLQSNTASSKILPNESQFSPLLSMEQNIATATQKDAASPAPIQKNRTDDESVLALLLLSTEQDENIEITYQEKASTSKPVAPPSISTNQTENFNEDKAHDCFTEDKSSEENNINSLDLSQKIDKIDERELWMLKSNSTQYNNETVIELGYGSGVFIKKADLKMDITNASSENVLARSILLDLFTDEALAESTIDGRGMSEGDKKRLRLPEVAINALLKYVHSHARKMNWKVTSDADIKRSLRDKIKELRNKNKRKGLLKLSA